MGMYLRFYGIEVKNSPEHFHAFILKGSSHNVPYCFVGWLHNCTWARVATNSCQTNLLVASIIIFNNIYIPSTWLILINFIALYGPLLSPSLSLSFSTFCPLHLFSPFRFLTINRKRKRMRKNSIRRHNGKKNVITLYWKCA